jgi:hypothetical protein
MPKAIDHPLMNTPTYKSWVKMKRRCTSPNAHNYKSYGGRGITFCERWKSFINFANDMGERPASHTLERIDNEGMYCPENCRWATQHDQCKNRRGCVKVVVNGKTLTATDAAKICTVHRKTIGKRIAAGMSSEDALKGGRSGMNKRHEAVKYKGKTRSVAEWSRIYGIPYKTLYRRITTLNWTVKRALTEPVG